MEETKDIAPVDEVQPQTETVPAMAEESTVMEIVEDLVEVVKEAADADPEPQPEAPAEEPIEELTPEPETSAEEVIEAPEPEPIAEPAPEPEVVVVPAPAPSPAPTPAPEPQPASQSEPQPTPPAKKFPTDRGLFTTIIFTLLTGSIYGIVVNTKIGNEVNTICTPHDGKHTMNYCLIFFVLTFLTFGIAPLVWTHRLCNRIGSELMRRRINYSFGADTFWIWTIIGSLIGIGPIIFTYKFMKAMNLLNADYNERG